MSVERDTELLVFFGYGVDPVMAYVQMQKERDVWRTEALAARALRPNSFVTQADFCTREQLNNEWSDAIRATDAALEGK